MLGSDYKTKLLELVDADQLPVEYGGTVRAPLGMMVWLCALDFGQFLIYFSLVVSFCV